MEGKKQIIEKMTGQNINISYTGPFDGQVLSVIAKNIEYSLSMDPNVNKKIFKIFLELAQNISYYSAEKTENNRGESSGVGILTIQEYDKHFIFATGNMVDSNLVEKINKKCKKINTLNRSDLREFKRELRKKPPGEKGGGNIGLIQVALTAENTLDYKFIPIDEKNMFYIIAVKINKTKYKEI